jgi:23S rRNA (cytidine1920-2'-O)/16S rRNA (cytidine1409-2'-O)-methyltransferase
MERRRLDTLLTERGLAGSRTSAAASVRAGRVRIGSGGRRATKPGQLVAADARLAVEEPPRYVSRGGQKLEHALGALGIEVDGRSCLDVGASTGGFTDCLLQRGAASVIALDVGYGQLEWRLRNNPRVRVMERQNARELSPTDRRTSRAWPRSTSLSSRSPRSCRPSPAACPRARSWPW